MALPVEYPVDLRADRPERSSRLWAVLTILLIKLLALIPHFFLLIFLGIAQWVVAFVAQFVVAARGEYPPGMFRFVVGVLRWSTRVSAFALSLSDRYPPFSLEQDASYPIDVVVERPPQHSRLYALFTVIVQLLFVVGMIVLAVALAREVSSSDTSWTSDYQQQWTSSWGSGLLLRQIAAIPHYIILFFLGIAVFVVWLIVQWVILFVGSYPKGMYDFSAGVVRWQVRVQAYSFGLIDCYPPFSFDPSVGAGPAGAAAYAAPPAPPPLPGTPVYQPAPAPQPPAPAADWQAPEPAAPPAPAAAPPPAWYPDPQGRHQIRYWNGAAWTSDVADDGVRSTDPV